MACGVDHRRDSGAQSVAPRSRPGDPRARERPGRAPSRPSPHADPRRSLLRLCAPPRTETCSQSSPRSGGRGRVRGWPGRASASRAGAGRTRRRRGGRSVDLSSRSGGTYGRPPAAYIASNGQHRRLRRLPSAHVRTRSQTRGRVDPPPPHPDPLPRRHAGERGIFNGLPARTCDGQYNARLRGNS